RIVEVLGPSGRCFFGEPPRMACREAVGGDAGCVYDPSTARRDCCVEYVSRPFKVDSSCRIAIAQNQKCQMHDYVCSIDELGHIPTVCHIALDEFGPHPTVFTRDERPASHRDDRADPWRLF